MISNPQQQEGQEEGGGGASLSRCSFPMFRRVVSFPPRMYPVCFQSIGLCLTDEEIIMYLYAAGASLQLLHKLCVFV
jgi:hypothetical protein